MNENLFDVLGVLTAFITVMLIFSIAITSLVQATQGLFRWRARNLQNGLAKILKSVQEDGSKDDAWQNAISVLNKSDAALINTKLDPKGLISRFFGPQLSWMDPDELDSELRKQQELGLSDAQKTDVSQKFRRSQGSMRKVFLRRMRLATIFWAFVIAFYYQLSTPDLLEDFSDNPELVKQLEQQGRDMLNRDKDTAEPPPANEDIATGETDDVDTTGNGAIDKGDTQQEFSGTDSTAHTQTGGTNTPTTTGSDEDDPPATSYFNLQPWQNGWCFFYHSAAADSECISAAADSTTGILKRVQWNNIIGMLMTVLLLSLGAPFWFDMLKSVVNLKVTLSKDTDSAKSGDADSGASEKSKSTDDRIELLMERMYATNNPVVRASLQKEINDLRLIRAELP